jgi:hypothetical protein
VAQAVSVRLDDEVWRALKTLEDSGMTRSEAIRKANLDAAAALGRREVLREEAVALESDADLGDRRRRAGPAARWSSHQPGRLSRLPG